MSSVVEQSHSCDSDACARTLADYRELVITDLADENAVLRDVNNQLVDVVADLTLENARLRILYDREFLSRFHGDIVIARLRRQQYGRAA